MLKQLKAGRKKLEITGIPGHVAAAVSKGFKLAEDKKIYGPINSDKDAKIFLRKFFGD